MGQVRWREVHKDGQLVIEEIHKVMVYSFNMGDVEDPELYAAEPLLKWQNSEAGKFVMDNAIEIPTFFNRVNQHFYGYEIVIIAELEKKKLSEYYLRFGKNDNSKT